MRIREVITYEDGKALAEIALASNETKPTDGLATGSTITEADTGKTFVLDEDSATWTEYTSGGGGGGGDDSLAKLIDGTIETIDVTISDVNGDHYFEGQPNLKSVKIKGTVQQLKANFCYNCPKLELVDIPESVTSITKNCFGLYSATSTKMTLYCRAVNPPTLGSNPFYGNRMDAIDAIYVPSASVDAYKSASGWSAVASFIQAIP